MSHPRHGVFGPNIPGQFHTRHSRRKSKAQVLLSARTTSASSSAGCPSGRLKFLGSSQGRDLARVLKIRQRGSDEGSVAEAAGVARAAVQFHDGGKSECVHVGGGREME